jgi:hypothetical protein
MTWEFVPREVYIKFHAKFIFVLFCMQEVFLFWICLILHAIEFFEKSIECLYSFFSEFREEYDGDVSFV